jgi:hypothetical protein
MSLTLRTYMAMLASNPDCLGDFIGDPAGAPARAGLSSEDQAILLSGNQHSIYDRVAAGNSGSETDS